MSEDMTVKVQIKGESGSAVKAVDQFQAATARLRQALGGVVPSFKGLAPSMDAAAGSAEKVGSAISGMTGSFLKAQIAFEVLRKSVTAILDTAKESTLMAARFETMGVVMGVVGNNAGYTRKEMDAFAEGLQKSGISMQASRDGLTKMTQAHLDLAQAQKLSRLAQDAAVIGNINSSEAFQTMIYGIQTGQPEVLRTIGLNVQFEASYAKLAKTLGKSKQDLTETERTQARFNEVMERAPDIAGAYEESMKTVGKQLLSMPRYADNLKIALGDLFGGALQVGVQEVNTSLQDMKKWLDENAIAASLVKENLRRAAEQFVGLVKDAMSLAKTQDGIVEGFTLMELLAGALNLTIRTIRDLFNTLVGDVQLIVSGLEMAVLAVPKLGREIQKLFGIPMPKWLDADTYWNAAVDLRNKGNARLAGANKINEFYNPSEPVEDPTVGYQRKPYSQTEQDKVIAAKRAAAEAAREEAEEAARAARAKREKDRVSEDEHKARLAQWRAESAERQTLKDQEDAAILKAEADLQKDLAKLKEEFAAGKLSSGQYEEERTARIAASGAEELRIYTDFAQKRKDLEERISGQIEATEASSLARREAAVRDTFRKIREEALKKNGTIDAATEQRIVDAEARALTRAKADALSEDLRFTQSQLQADEQGITNLQDAGMITILDAQRRRADAIAARLPALQAALASLWQQAEAASAKAQSTGSADDQVIADNLVLQARQASNEVQVLTTNLQVCRNEWANVQQAGANALASGLVEALGQVASGTKSVSDAFRSMAQNIIQSISQALAKMMLMQAAQSMFGGAAAGGNTWAQAAIKAFGGSWAGGGYTGPGGKYEPAGIVHRGEYVHDQETTAFWGTAFMESLHPRRLRGYAGGGQVGPPSSGELSAAFTHTIGLSLDRGLIAEYLSGPEGARVISSNVASNRKRFNRALGRR